MINLVRRGALPAVLTVVPLPPFLLRRAAQNRRNSRWCSLGKVVTEKLFGALSQKT